MKQTTLIKTMRTILAVAALMATLAGASAAQQTYNFLGSSTGSWVGYAGSPVPTLVTTTPGSIVDTTAAGSSYGRLSSGFAAYFGSWRVGDAYAFHFDGVVSNATSPFRLEFSNGAATTAGLLGLQLVIVNGATSGGDLVQVNSLSGTSSLLFSGNFGGVNGVGTSQRILADITFTLGATTATVTGTLADSLGNLWTGPGTTINLGTAPASIFAGMNVNAGGGISAINGLSWSLTPVPEPNTAALFAGLGVAALVFGRRLRRKS
jgi:hypothetical protein